MPIRKHSLFYLKYLAGEQHPYREYDGVTLSYNHNSENWLTSLHRVGQPLFDNSIEDVLVSVNNWRCLQDTCLSEIELLTTSPQVTGQNLSLPALNKSLQLHKIISSNFFKRKPNHGAENIIWFTRHLIRALHKLNKIQSTYLTVQLSKRYNRKHIIIGYLTCGDSWGFYSTTVNGDPI